MRKTLITLALVTTTAGLASSAAAQQPAAPQTPQQTMPQQQMTPQQYAPQPSMLRGAESQPLFDATGGKIGTIKAVVTDGGQEQAVVSISRFLGLGSRDVLVPGATLQPKSGGGFTTSMSEEQVDALPGYDTGSK